MLGKLIKYDFKSINKVMYIYFIVAFILALLTRFVETLEQITIVTIIDKILVGTLISCMFSIAITCLLRIWAKFRTSIYKDESYLTHTLPVKKSTIYNSKMIVAYISVIISFIVILACFFIVLLNNGMFEYIKDTFNQYAEVIGKTKLIALIIAVICTIILEVMYLMQAGIFGIILGHKSNNHKTLKSIIFGIVSYMFLSTLTLAILYIIAIINPTLMELYRTETPSIDVIEQLIYVGLAIYMAYNIMLYIAGKKMLQKGVNVD